MNRIPRPIPWIRSPNTIPKLVSQTGSPISCSNWQWVRLLIPNDTSNKCLNWGTQYCKRGQNISKCMPKEILPDNAPPHTTKPVKDTLQVVRWEVLPHIANLPDLVSSDYHLFASTGHAFAEHRFTTYENIRKFLDEWFALRNQQFFWQGIHKLHGRWEKCGESNGQYFE